MSVSTLNVYCYYKIFSCNCLNISKNQNKIIYKNIFQNNFEIIIVKNNHNNNFNCFFIRKILNEKPYIIFTYVL